MTIQILIEIRDHSAHSTGVVPFKAGIQGELSKLRTEARAREINRPDRDGATVVP